MANAFEAVMDEMAGDRKPRKLDRIIGEADRAVTRWAEEWLPGGDEAADTLRSQVTQAIRKAAR
jgi:hypothetical protein